MKSYIIQCRTLCEIPEVNWLKFGGVVRVSELDHQFFVFLFFLSGPGTNSTGVWNYPSFNTVMQDYTALGKLKLKALTGHINRRNGISNKTVSDKFVALSCYLLKYKLFFSVLHLIYLFSYHFSLRYREPNAGRSLK